MQTAQDQIAKALADGAGHTFTLVIGGWGAKR
jgi:hypothetical protein